jgi:hypothetical protein
VIQAPHAISGAFLGLFIPTAQAQTIHPLVVEGDVVPGMGQVTRIDNIAVLNADQWLVEVDTDHADTDADGALLNSAGLVFREGQALTSPVGASLDSFDSIRFDSFGRVGYNFFLDGTAGTTDDSGVYSGSSLLVQEGASSISPALTPGSPYRGFFDVKADSQAGGSLSLLLLATVDDPIIPSTVDQVLVSLVTGAGGGTLVAEEMIAKEGDILPGQTEAIATFGTAPHSSAYAGPGLEMFFADLLGDTATDGVIYLGSTLLAQEGSASPIAGRAWASLSSPELDVTESGAYAFSGSLSGDVASNLLIVRNGVAFVQEGDSLPDINGFALTSLGTGPLSLSNTGDLLWYGDWDDPDTDRDTGLFLNGDLLVQEGVTTVAGSTIDSLRGIQDGYFLSEDGQHVIFDALLLDGREGAFLIRLGIGDSYCTAAAGSLLGVGTSISASGSASIASNALTLIANPAPVQPGIFYFGTTQIQVPFGSGFRCVGGTTTRLPVIFPSSGTATFSLDLAALGMAPGSRNFQYWFRDIGGGPSTFNLSDGLEIVFVP